MATYLNACGWFVCGYLAVEIQKSYLISETLPAVLQRVDVERVKLGPYNYMQT